MTSLCTGSKCAPRKPPPAPLPEESTTDLRGELVIPADPQERAQLTLQLLPLLLDENLLAQLGVRFRRLGIRLDDTTKKEEKTKTKNEDHEGRINEICLLSSFPDIESGASFIRGKLG